MPVICISAKANTYIFGGSKIDCGHIVYIVIQARHTINNLIMHTKIIYKAGYMDTLHAYMVAPSKEEVGWKIWHPTWVKCQKMKSYLSKYWFERCVWPINNVFTANRLYCYDQEVEALDLITMKTTISTKALIGLALLVNCPYLAIRAPSLSREAILPPTCIFQQR